MQVILFNLKKLNLGFTAYLPSTDRDIDVCLNRTHVILIFVSKRQK